MQNLGYTNTKTRFHSKQLESADYKILSLKLKLVKNINSCVSYILTGIWIIAIVEFVRFCFDLYSYLH